jgi:aryl-alcohol dehydrogenase-like predicted oxidoreductase
VKYRPLGQTGLRVSEIGFGAWGIGGRTSGHTSYGDTDDRVSLAALERALACGITFYDTSSAYGDGHSEVLIGRAFARRRQHVVIATKAGYSSWNRAPDFSPSAVIASAEASLRRLQSDYIDLLQLHNPPVPALASPELRQAFDRLKTAGKIRAWGVSAKSPAEAIDAVSSFGAAVVQANFNMMDVRVVSGGLLDLVSKSGCGFVARTPLCFGFLSGMIDRQTSFSPGDHRLGWSRVQLDNWIDGAIELLAAVGATAGAEGARAALRFCLSFDAVSTVIPGILSPSEAEQNAAASARGPLSACAVSEVMAINARRQFFVSSPGPS